MILSNKFINKKAYFHTSSHLNFDIASIITIMPVDQYADLIQPIIETLNQAKTSFVDSVHHYGMRNSIIEQYKFDFSSQEYIETRTLERQAMVNENQGNHFLERAEERIRQLKNQQGHSIFNKLEARHAENGLDNLDSIMQQTLTAKVKWIDAIGNKLQTPKIK